MTAGQLTHILQKMNEEVKDFKNVCLGIKQLPVG